MLFIKYGLKQSITGELNTHSVKCDLTLPKLQHLFSVYDVGCKKILQKAIQNGLEKVKKCER